MPQTTPKCDLFASLMGRSTFLFILSALAAFTLLFRFVPELDLATASLFFDDGFYLGQHDFWRMVRKASINLTILMAVFVIFGWVIWLLRPPGSRHFSVAQLGFPAVCLLLGPLLMTNAILKEYWGRPRPKELDMFGGQAQFVLPWDISDQCATNCSFVSGETSAALWMITLVPLLPLGWQRFAIALALIYVIMVSALRIAFGGHFLSDVIFSILLNLLVIWGAWGLFFERLDYIKPRRWAATLPTAGPLYNVTAPIRHIPSIQKHLHLLATFLHGKGESKR